MRKLPFDTKKCENLKFPFVSVRSQFMKRIIFKSDISTLIQAEMWKILISSNSKTIERVFFSEVKRFPFRISFLTLKINSDYFATFLTHLRLRLHLSPRNFISCRHHQRRGKISSNRLSKSVCNDNTSRHWAFIAHIREMIIKKLLDRWGEISRATWACLCLNQLDDVKKSKKFSLSHSWWKDFSMKIVRKSS